MTGFSGRSRLSSSRTRSTYLRPRVTRCSVRIAIFGNSSGDATCVATMPFKVGCMDPVGIRNG